MSLQGPEPNNTVVSLDNLKEWFTFAAAVITCVVAIVFWVQTSSDSKFAKVESEIQILRKDIDKMQENNQKILRIIGRLEGKLSN